MSLLVTRVLIILFLSRVCGVTSRGLRTLVPVSTIPRRLFMTRIGAWVLYMVRRSITLSVHSSRVVSSIPPTV